MCNISIVNFHIPVVDLQSLTPSNYYTVKFHSGLNMPSPSLRCQARRPQSKKVRLACVLPSGLDVRHKHHV